MNPKSNPTEVRVAPVAVDEEPKAVTVLPASAVLGPSYMVPRDVVSLGVSRLVLLEVLAAEFGVTKDKARNSLKWYGYEPVRIGDREYVDTWELDIAVLRARYQSWTDEQIHAYQAWKGQQLAGIQRAAILSSLRTLGTPKGAKFLNPTKRNRAKR